MKKKGIVILGAGLLQCPLIQTAKKRNWIVISCDQNPKAPGAALSDFFLEISTRDHMQLIKELEKYHNQFHYCATLGTDMTASVAAVNEAYNLGGLTTKQASVTTHKGKMREFLSSIGLKQPSWFVTKNRDDAYRWALDKNFKNGFVIKPSHNMGARGVMFLSRPEDLSFAFEYAQVEAQNGEIILEEYIPADELSVDALSLTGNVYITGLADRNIDLKDGRYFIETGHTMPTQRHPDKFSEINLELLNVATALGRLENNSYTGVLKGDIRITSSGEVVIGEIATRLSGGFMSTHTYPLSTGNDLLEAYLDILENKVPELILNKKNNHYENVTIERAFLADPGQVEIIHIPDNIDDSNATLRHTFIHYGPGSLIESLQCNVGKPANVIISAESLCDAEAFAKNLQKHSKIMVNLKPLLQSEINSFARKKFNKKYCHVCKVCDGKNCASGVPGMGGIDNMKAFQDNIISLSEINIDYNKLKVDQVNTSSNFLGKKIPFPILNAPITGSISNMGGSITEYDYAIEISSAMKALGLPCLFGDGADPLKYHTALEAMRQSKAGYLVVKPRLNNDEIIKRIQDAEESGADGWGIDIDAINLKTMMDKRQITVKKSPEEISKISKNTRLPFFIKGIMNSDQALRMADTGARAIVVSNHGGRVDDSLPGAARVLENISNSLKNKFPEVQIYADGGIRSGEDVFKMLALGADGVLVGRPVTIAAIAAGKQGVYSILKTYYEELCQTMQNTGSKSMDSISVSNIEKFEFKKRP